VILRILKSARTLLVASVVAASLLTLTAANGIAYAQEEAQEEQAEVHLLVPEEPVDRDEGELVVPIDVTSVENLGAFGFLLTFDGDVLELIEIEEGDFLGSTGREVVCDAPVVDTFAVMITCVTLRMEPDGPSGDGNLANITFRLKGTGTTDLQFDRIELTDPLGTRIPASINSARLTVEGGSRLTWPVVAAGGGIIALIAIVGAAGGFLLWRRAS
jgi:hypothetical protein